MKFLDEILELDRSRAPIEIHAGQSSTIKMNITLQTTLSFPSS